MSYDTGIDFEEGLICSKYLKKRSINIENNGLKLQNLFSQCLLCIKLNTQRDWKAGSACINPLQNCLFINICYIPKHPVT